MSDLTLSDLFCEYKSPPLGIETFEPRLGWRLRSETRGQKQRAYQILVSISPASLEKNLGEVWDTGKVVSDQSVQIIYQGKPLQSLTRYYWKVRVWDKNGEPTAFSEPNWWEMGLLNETDWRAKWITHEASLTSKTHPFAPIFRKSFSLSRQVHRARAFICGLGYYELYINGKRIGDHILDPGQTDYDKRAFYVTYDVTDALKEGRNAIGFILGNGWYNQARVWEPEIYGVVAYGLPRAICQVYIEYENGEKETVLSDATWKTARGPILENNIYAGEVYDARLEISGWSEANYEDRSWKSADEIDGPGGKLVSQNLEPIKKIKTIKPVSIAEPQKGLFVVDFGQNFSGWCRLKVSAPAGTKITMRFAEDVDEAGMIDPASTGVFATHVVQTDVYICKGAGLEIWEPRFTYHGFRYMEIIGLPSVPTAENVEGILVHSAVAKAGHFECSDPMFNRLQETAVWTEVSNLHSVPEDCPARERCGWLGDAQVTAEMAVYNFNLSNFWTKYIGDMITTLDEKGVPNMIAPGRRTGGRAVPLWGSAMVQIPWYQYLFYDDIRILEDSYEAMKNWLRHLQGIAKDFIVSDCLGDWCPPGSISPVETPVSLTATAYFYFDTILMLRIAERLNRKEDIGAFRQLAMQIKDKFIHSFYDSALSTFGSQTADALSLYLDLFPEGEGEKIAESLARDVMEKHHGHHSTGIVGSRYLYSVLADHGYGSVAWTMLHQTDFPGFGYIFSKGATTFWECWHEKAVGKTGGPRSKNHPMHGGFAAWFYQTLAGINPVPEYPGFKRFIIKPVPVDRLSFVHAWYNSNYGIISSEWSRDDRAFSLRVCVPPNTNATIFIPNGYNKAVLENGIPAEKQPTVHFLNTSDGYSIYEVDSGRYHFTVSASEDKRV